MPNGNRISNCVLIETQLNIQLLCQLGNILRILRNFIKKSSIQANQNTDYTQN